MTDKDAKRVELQREIDALVIQALAEARWPSEGGAKERPIGRLADELTDRILALIYPPMDPSSVPLSTGSPADEQ